MEKEKIIKNLTEYFPGHTFTIVDKDGRSDVLANGILMTSVTKVSDMSKEIEEMADDALYPIILGNVAKKFANLVLQKNSLNKKKQKVDKTKWIVFYINNEDYWVDRSKISFVSGIDEDKINKEFGFHFIVSGARQGLQFGTEAEARDVKKFLTNVDTIPEFLKGEINLSSEEDHKKHREDLLNSLR